MIDFWPTARRNQAIRSHGLPEKITVHTSHMSGGQHVTIESSHEEHEAGMRGARSGIS